MAAMNQRNAEISGRQRFDESWHANFAASH